MRALPKTGYLRLPQIIGVQTVTKKEVNRIRREAERAKKFRKNPKSKPKQPRNAIPAIISVGKSTWWVGVKTGYYPLLVRALGVKITCWSVEKILALVKELAKQGEAA